jgi:hypothetical protein
VREPGRAEAPATEDDEIVLVTMTGEEIALVAGVP